MSRLQPSVLSRRAFVVATAAAGAVFGLDRAAAATAADDFAPTPRFRIDPDGVTWINIAKAEMGQHIGTALARILADELEADWDAVRLVPVDTDPRWGMMVTGASASVWQTYPVFSRAGAAGRIALLEAGAALLGAAPGDCVARAGHVEAGGRAIGYGEIVRRGDLRRRFDAPELAALPIKTPDTWTLIGRPAAALDVPDKTRGAAVYGIDAEVAGMVYARPKLPPTRYGSTVLSIDDSRARTVRGYLRSIVLDDPSGTVPGWVMVIAETYPAAIRATDLVEVTWRRGETAAVLGEDLRRRAHALIADRSAGAILDTGGGDVEAALAGAVTRIEATYTTDAVLHSPSSRSTRLPSSATAPSRSTPATRRRASSCPFWPRRSGFRSRRSSCGPTHRRRVRPPTERRLLRARRTRRAGARTPGQDVADPRGRLAAGLDPLAHRSDAAQGVRRRARDRRDGPCRRRRLAGAGDGAAGAAEGHQRRPLRSLFDRRRRSLVRGGRPAGPGDQQRPRPEEFQARLAPRRGAQLDQLGA